MKKLLTLLLSAAMTVTLMPVAASADSVDYAANVKNSASAADFTDVSSSAWYASAVEYVVSNGIMNGVDDNRFNPESNLTRGMIVQMLYNLEGKPAGAPDSGFTDVASSAWYKDAVNWAAASGTVAGLGDSRFGPENEITREQMAAVMKRYAKYKGYKASESVGIFTTDSDQISSWALNDVRWAVGEKILSGVGDDRMDPKGTASRAQVAQVFKNFNYTVVKDNLNTGDGWNAVNYTVERDDRSRPYLDYYYDYVQITDSDYPYAGKINADLMAEKNRFFAGADEQIDDLYFPDPEFPQFWGYYNLCVYDKNGILSTAACGDMAMGGTWHPKYIAHTYDLNTGQELTLPEILGKSDQETMDLFLDIIGVTDGSYDETMVEMYGDPRDADPEKLKYYIDENGEIWILLNTFEYSYNGDAFHDTGYNISYLR